MLTSDSLRERVGLVPQNPVLFDSTVMDNVRYGKITASDQEVYDACRAACIHDKIEEFTDGLSLYSLSIQNSH